MTHINIMSHYEMTHHELLYIHYYHEILQTIVNIEFDIKPNLCIYIWLQRSTF